MASYNLRKEREEVVNEAEKVEKEKEERKEAPPAEEEISKAKEKVEDLTPEEVKEMKEDIEKAKTEEETKGVLKKWAERLKIGIGLLFLIFYLLDKITKQTREA